MRTHIVCMGKNADQIVNASHSSKPENKGITSCQFFAEYSIARFQDGGRFVR